MRKVFFGIVFILIFLSSCNSTQQGVELADVTKFEMALQEKDVQLVDVRTDQEFTNEHINGALHIDVLQDDFKLKAEQLDKNRPVLVYCKSGGRSSNAASILKEMGFKEVIDLDGGIATWKKENKAVVK